ncbi:LVIVD repeat-containing protein [Mariniflexile sp.]|uniref:LVIVD repeat-containing protein n=2 Tax=Mariniflexile sp. TaxID=1979402 RepID=UPI004048D689
MKLKHIFLSLIFISALSCDKDDANYEFVEVATPQIMSKAEFRKSVAIVTPRDIEKAGKIYAYKDYIFVSDVGKGVHVIDNANPKFPKKIKYLKIPGNEDISVKNDFLYADSATDLLVFDISNINSISLKQRLEDVFSIYNFQMPLGTRFVNNEGYNYQTDIIVGWTVTKEKREKIDNRLIDFAFEGAALNSGTKGSTTGQGGSLARFQIVNNYLYTVASHEMIIFNISNLTKPTLASSLYAGNNIETLFQADGYLYIGSTDGMYIYDLVNPEKPTRLSEFVHWTGCDPVVVDGDYAYLTLRGGNNCGEQESVLEVIDIKDKTKPTLAARYTLENPYGLGIKNNTLFICDGTAGLKLFNKENPLKIYMVKQFKNIQSKDVIPLEDKLLMIGGNTLYQYNYVQDGVQLISSFPLK